MELKLSSTNILKSAIFFPGHYFFKEGIKLIVLSNKLAISTKSFSSIPLVVIAGEPVLIPPGFKALLSPGTVFLLV